LYSHSLDSSFSCSPFVLPFMLLFSSFPISVFCFYLLYFFRINISSYSTSFALFFIYYAQNLVLFGISAFSESVFTQCHRAGAT
jgi:hypothetical protein